MVAKAKYCVPEVFRNAKWKRNIKLALIISAIPIQKLIKTILGKPANNIN